MLRRIDEMASKKVDTVVRRGERKGEEGIRRRK